MKAFSIVRVPPEEEERARAMSRQGQQLVRERQRLAAMGRSLLAMHNLHVAGRWWKGKAWARIQVQPLGWVVERLEVNTAVIVSVEAHEVKLTSPPHSSMPVPVLTVSGAAGAKAISLQLNPRGVCTVAA